MDGTIKWSQPEIALYSLDPEIMGMSYPDFIEQEGELWISKTQKNIARTHKIDLDLVQGLWDQGKDNILVDKGIVMEAWIPEVTDGIIYLHLTSLNVDSFVISTKSKRKGGSNVCIFQAIKNIGSHRQLSLWIK